MRFTGTALLTCVALLTACGGGESNTTDTTSAPSPTPDTSAPVATVAAAPITGTTHEVKMVGDAQGYRFEPANLTIKQGDGVKFVMVSGAPHNVAFDPATVPAAAKAQLSANMPNQMSELSSPMMMNPNESYTISFGGIPAGKYPYVCTPHLAMNMKGEITVQ